MSNPIRIQPEMGIYKVLKHLNYKAWWALSEFVDNSLQSFIVKNGKYGETRQFCLVDIRYDPNEKYLSIEDNSYGISEEDHQRAFTAGIPPDDASGLSEFGVGMKSAGIWFSPDWKVTTCAIDSELAYVFHMKLEELVSGDGTLTPTIIKSPARRGYTKIELFNLHHGIHGRTIGKIKDHLKSIYRCFLREGRLKIIFNGEELRYEEPPILVAKPAWAEAVVGLGQEVVEWKKAINFTLTSGIHVTGFAAVREIGSTREAGLSIFRRNRVVLGSYDDKFRPPEVFGQPNSFEYQRLFGELHINGVEVSHTKDSINLGEYEEEFLEKLRDAINSEPKQLIRQARAYKAKTLDLKTIKAITEVTAKVTQAFTEAKLAEQKEIACLADLNDHQRQLKASENEYPVQESSTAATNLADAKLKAALDKNKGISFLSGGIDWNVFIRVEAIESSKLYTISYRDQSSREPQAKRKNVDILINREHELFLSECNSSKEATTVLILMLVTIAVTEMLLTGSGNLFARLIHKGFNEQVNSVYKGMQVE